MSMSMSSTGLFSTSMVSRAGSIQVVRAHTISRQSHTSTSSFATTTTMNLVYVNWRSWLHTPIIKRRAWPG